MATNKPEVNDERPEFDFSKAKSNPYAERYAEGTNVVLLDPDVMKYFPDSKSVNEALRRLIEREESTANT